MKPSPLIYNDFFTMRKKMAARREGVGVPYESG